MVLLLLYECVCCVGLVLFYELVCWVLLLLSYGFMSGWYCYCCMAFVCFMALLYNSFVCYHYNITVLLNAVVAVI